MKLSEFDKITYEVNRGVALVTLNNPARRNAWGGRMSVEYRWALYHAHTDDSVRVVVVTGIGDDFCVGADTSELSTIESAGGAYQKAQLELPPYPETAPEAFRRNHAYPWCIEKPVIAAVNGRCAGVGFIVASYADLRFGARNSVLKTAFSKLGLPAEYGLGWILPRIMGKANAMQILLEGDKFSGEEGLRLGWLQKLYEPDQLLEETLRYAQKLAKESASYSLSCMKRQLNFDAEGDFSDAYTRSVTDMNTALTHPDFKEGLRALKEKRPTNFLD
ncbi:MAG: enoyl-CoA hydratase/isomerase family protein [Congregibacter sp.]|nr:enoyl-CoA hydratase/isomerase family protein [Congregibacter sp.]